MYVCSCRVSVCSQSCTKSRSCKSFIELFLFYAGTLYRNNMATALEDALTCPVCTDNFDDPKILACGHTFCMSCLDEMFASEPDQYLTCPVCRQVNLVPEGDVSKLLTNITVKGLVEDIQSATHIELQKKAEIKIAKIIKHAECIDQEKQRVNETVSACRGEIEKACEEAVAKLVERKAALLHICDDHESTLQEKLNKLAVKDNDVVSSLRNALKLIPDCVKASGTGDMGNAYDTLCESMTDLLKANDSDLSEATAITRRGHMLNFIKKRIDLNFGEVEAVEWKLKSEVELSAKDNILIGIAPTPDGLMAVGSHTGGIELFSADGVLRQKVLDNYEMRRITFLSDGQCVVRDTNNHITLYTTKWKEREVRFGTLSSEEGGSGGLAADGDDNIYVGFRKMKKIQVFSSAGGRAIKEIACDGYEPCQLLVLEPSKVLVVVTEVPNVLHVIDDRGTILHEVTKDKGTIMFPAVCRDGTVLVACINEKQNKVSIEQYTSEWKCVKTLVTDHVIEKTERGWYYLREFRSGDLALSTADKLYIFKKSSFTPDW